MYPGSTVMIQRPKTLYPAETSYLPQTQEAKSNEIHREAHDNTFVDSTDIIYIYWIASGRTINKEFIVEVLREFRMRLRRKRPKPLSTG